MRRDLRGTLTAAAISVDSTKVILTAVSTELGFWFERNELIINVGKTAVMSFHSRQWKVSSKTRSYFQYNESNLHSWDNIAGSQYHG